MAIASSVCIIIVVFNPAFLPNGSFSLFFFFTICHLSSIAQCEKMTDNYKENKSAVGLESVFNLTNLSFRDRDKKKNNF